jgi:hypothetical protein
LTRKKEIDIVDKVDRVDGVNKLTRLKTERNLLPSNGESVRLVGRKRDLLKS